MLADYGLNPDDASADLDTPVGIGNVAGQGASEGRLYDGMNQTGDYQDTTGYMPVNSAFVLRDPSRWQPGVRLQGTGVYTIQQFVTPQLANTEPMAEIDPRSLRVPPPDASEVENWEAYKLQVDDVLEISANLADEQKLMAELFDNKIVSLGLSYVHLARELDLSPADTVRGYFVKGAAALDSSVVIWQEKARFDAVRPFSAIRHVYGDDLVRLGAVRARAQPKFPPAHGRAICRRPIIQNIRRARPVAALRPRRQCVASPVRASSIGALVTLPAHRESNQVSRQRVTSPYALRPGRTSRRIAGKRGSGEVFISQLQSRRAWHSVAASVIWLLSTTRP